MVGSLPSVQSSLKTVPQPVVIHAFQARTPKLPLETTPGVTHIHPTRLVRVRGWAENQVLWCNMHNVEVGVRMAKLATLQLVQSVDVRSTTGFPINQKVGAPPPLGFPNTMLSVKRVKHNM